MDMIRNDDGEWTEFFKGIGKKLRKDREDAIAAGKPDPAMMYFKVVKAPPPPGSVEWWTLDPAEQAKVTRMEPGCAKGPFMVTNEEWKEVMERRKALVEYPQLAEFIVYGEMCARRSVYANYTFTLPEMDATDGNP